MNLFNTIYLKDAEFDNYEYINDGDNPLRIDNLAKINLFVGANNSGKSRFIRNLFSLGSVDYSNDASAEKVNYLLDEVYEKVAQLFARYRIKDYANLKQKLGSVNRLDTLIEGVDCYSDLRSHFITMKEISGTQTITTDNLNNFYQNQYDEMNNSLNTLGNEYESKLDTILTNQLKNNLNKVYIPTLRGLRPFKNNEDYYLNRTVKDYFSEELVNKNNFKVFTGAKMYEEVKDLLLGSYEDREKIKLYQEFLSEYFFDHQDVLLIPNTKSDVLYVKIGNEAERPIYSLGDGIQSIIIMTFQPFYYKGMNSMFFIEEPEIFLHPGLQRKLLISLNTFENCQFFITTHSNHLLDLTIDIEGNDISVFKFNKVINENDKNTEIIPNFKIENVSNGDVSVLEILGVKDSSVFLANCTIWVEGITDRFYLRHYLKLYMDNMRVENNKEYYELKEDINYAFVEYGGNNITHWSFLDSSDDVKDEKYKSINVDSICKKILLITDRDSEKKDKRHKQLEANLGENYYCLNVKEIENLISVKTLKKVLIDYERLNSMDELKFTSNFTEKGYSSHYLGSFIDKKLSESKRTYSSQSGTIKDKLTFCKKAIKNCSHVSDMSLEALKISEAIYNFIIRNNK